MKAFWSQLFRESAPLPPAIPNRTPPCADDDPFAAARQKMVEDQLRGRDIVHANVLRVMGQLRRERFVGADMQSSAYRDHPLPIGLGQTISQPYIVALMTQLARPTPKCRALEIGVGSGYQTAILAELCREVYGLEILQPLADAARERLRSLGYANVTIRCADGYGGWPEHAPFDVILAAAAPEGVPEPLLEQLAPGGRMVIPIGRGFQELMLLCRRRDGSIECKSIAPVQFVPMTGEAETRRP